MNDYRNGELRWFIGKVIHCARTARSQPEAFEVLGSIKIPYGLESEIWGDRTVSPLLFYAETVMAAARELYGTDTPDCRRVLAEINSAVMEAEKLPSGPASEHVEELDQADGPDYGKIKKKLRFRAAKREVLQDSEASLREANQIVTAAGSINAPVINAPGGRVSINDQSQTLDNYLRSYPTYLLYLALRIKERNVAPELRDVIAAALSALVSYHDKTRTSVAHKQELRWIVEEAASPTFDIVDRACRLAVGAGIKEVPTRFPSYPFPDYDICDQMVLVPGGFDPHTQQEVGPYYISRFPITVQGYSEFCRMMKRKPVPEWRSINPPEDILDHPVTGVTLLDAVNFCVWLELATGFRFRLPTETEWCFAATAGSQREFPWGNTYVPGYAITSHESPSGTRPVWESPKGSSPFGVQDMIGNVWELVATLHQEEIEANLDFDLPPIPGILTNSEWWSTDCRLPQGAGDWPEAARFVMRGGSWGGDSTWAAMSRRIWTSMFNRGGYGGFRIACSAERIGAGYIPAASFLSMGAVGLGRMDLKAEDEATISLLLEGSCPTTISSGPHSERLRERLYAFTALRYQSINGKEPSSSPSVCVDALTTEHSFPRLIPDRR